MLVSGTVENIIFRSGDTGFTVLELSDESGGEITAVGGMPCAAVGERVELEGDWTEHGTYGTQFRVTACRTLSPADLGAMTMYLGSGLIKGMGESTARNVVAAFGMDALNVIENQPERLAEVYGIGRVKAQTIAASYMAQKDMREIIMGLQQYGISVSQAAKLYGIYGPLCIEKIRENPYRLIDEIEGIGFRTADDIARNAGFGPDSPFRIRAGLKYTLGLSRQSGHTFLPREKLTGAAADILGAPPELVERELDGLITDESVVYKIVDGTDACFLPCMYRMEHECAVRLAKLASLRPRGDAAGRGIQTGELEALLNISLAPRQEEAVRLALSSGILVITGGPGTGKTTILRFVITMLEKMGESIELCAPTGRAAKRMTEAAGREARTIHRMLEYSYGENGFSRNQDNPIDADAVIVDEMSMVDVPLMWALLRAVPPGTRLIMVGDSDQLPPVGPGSVLRDIIDSGMVPVVRLTDIFRQAGRSDIVANAHRINSGLYPNMDGREEFGFEAIGSAEGVLRRLIALCSGGAGGLGVPEPLRDIQVLSPMKKGTLGVRNLNLRLQEALNPPMHKKRERRSGDTVFREGDKVMQVKNDYRMGWKRSGPGVPDELGEGVYNGDIGTVMEINLGDQTVEVLFDDRRTALYEFGRLDELELAYCISIHKSQGSEFPAVLLPLLDGPPMLMTRNLLYTAVTRARNRVCILGSRRCVERMVDNNKTRRRYSALSCFMKSAGEMPV